MEAGERGSSAPSSLEEEEGGWPSRTSSEGGTAWSPSASLEEGRALPSLPARMTERASLEREERREGTTEREYGHPLPLDNRRRGLPPPASLEEMMG